MAKPNKNSKRACRRIKNSQIALELRLKGYSYPKIASTMGLSTTYVHRLVETELKRCKEMTAETREQIKDQELMRLDRLLEQAKEHLLKEWCTKTAKIVLDIQSRRTLYLGLDDAVSRIEVSTIDKLSDNEIRDKAMELLQVEVLNHNHTEAEH